jgi:glycosyltransferase involved in cell wall biosynthesis
VRIALVAPVEETIPPSTYGGIEAVVHLLDRGLAARGNDVTLLASGGSLSDGRLVPLTDAPLTADGRDRDPAETVVWKEMAARRAARLLADLSVDVVLNHSWRLIDHLESPPHPVVTTVHYPLDTDPYRSAFLTRPQATYVSVSWSQQRAAAGSLRFAGNIYNGIDLAELPFSARAEGYLAFLGRVSPDKGLDLAIRAARKVGMPMLVAAKVDGVQRPWFDAVIAPLLHGGGVEMIGEVNASERADLLGGANVLMHPSRWSEPFGMAAVEAMACGTPVVALRRGAADEVIGHDISGVVVDDESELADAVTSALGLSRVACRAHVAAHFTHTRMAAEYEELASKFASKQA